MNSRNLPWLLQKQWAENKLHHAYLLVGSLKAGEEVARSFILEELKVGFLDRFFLTSEGSLKIEDVRQLIHFLSLKPAGSVYKAALISPAENLTPEAANALLKTLEEPPANSLLFLVTTDFHFLLPTLVSRCLRLKIEEKRREEKAGPALKEILMTSLAKRFALAKELSEKSNLAQLFHQWQEEMEEDLQGERGDVKLAEKLLELGAMAKSNVNKRLLLENLFWEE